MAGYADIEKIEKLLVRGIDECGDAIISIRDVRKAIAQAKTADVQEVRHGMWMYCGKSSGHDHMWQCSECLRVDTIMLNKLMSKNLMIDTFLLCVGMK